MDDSKLSDNRIGLLNIQINETKYVKEQTVHATIQGKCGLRRSSVYGGQFWMIIPSKPSLVDLETPSLIRDEGFEPLQLEVEPLA